MSALCSAVFHILWGHYIYIKDFSKAFNHNKHNLQGKGLPDKVSIVLLYNNFPYVHRDQLPVAPIEVCRNPLKLLVAPAPSLLCTVKVEVAYMSTRLRTLRTSGGHMCSARYKFWNSTFELAKIFLQNPHLTYFKKSSLDR